jgi:hypothetical protein
MPAYGLAAGRSFTQLSVLKRKMEENDNVSVFRLNYSLLATLEMVVP